MIADVRLIISVSKVLSSDRGLGLKAETETAVPGSLKTTVLERAQKSFKMTHIESKSIHIWLKY